MIPVLDSSGMKRADAETIQTLGLPSLVLMETAAGVVTEAIEERFSSAGRVVVVCGPGNNGGDGLSVARQLHVRGWEATAVLLPRADRLSGDAAVQLGLAASFGVPVVRLEGGGLDPLAAALSSAALVVDALFGTGLDRPLAGLARAAVELVDACGAPIVAVDIPSGLSGSSSRADWPCLTAELTVALAAPKLPHVLPPACYRCGELAVGTIGIPAWVLEKNATVWLLEDEDVAGWLPVREPDAHKGHFGHFGVLAGRRGRAGAAALAAHAAVTAGAGLVTVGTAAEAVGPIQSAVPEAMVDVVADGRGRVASDAALDAFLAKLTVLAVGPGIGTGEPAKALLDRVLAKWKGPIVVDADGLTLLAGDLEALRRRGAPTVVTPHPGELARILGKPIAEVVADRLEAAREAARRSGAVVLAKGARTLVVEPSGRALVNPTGTPGLASGGAGDTLTGLIGALLAQGVAPVASAAAGAFLHGRAAELAESHFPAAVPAGSLAGFVAEAWRELVTRGEGAG
jgi:ADP-dependent NAD(P)H-hydrate dehydratase / NAD(P)H-hydrate epimerase